MAGRSPLLPRCKRSLPAPPPVRFWAENVESVFPVFFRRCAWPGSFRAGAQFPRGRGDLFPHIFAWAVLQGAFSPLGELLHPCG